MEAQADSSIAGGRVDGVYSNFQPTTTPSGALKEGPGRPNNVVVCPALSSNNRHAYVTFGGGGLFVVDITTEPMSIVAEYTNDVISAAGCGGREAAGFMHLNAGVSASGAGADDSTFIMYRLPLDYPDGANPHTAPNTPPAVKFYEEKTLNIAEVANCRNAGMPTDWPSPPTRGICISLTGSRTRPKCSIWARSSTIRTQPWQTRR